MKNHNCNSSKRIIQFTFKITGLLVLLTFYFNGFSQSPWKKLSQRTSTLGLEGGISKFDAGAVTLLLVNKSQTVAGLVPKNEKEFDFTPSDSLKVRSADGLYHLGDINLRLRPKGSQSWRKYSTATARKPISPLPAQGAVLAAADLSPSLPGDMPVKVFRYWEMQDGDLALRFRLENTSSNTIEIGSLGIPMIFDNILEGRTLEQTHAKNVFYDPYIGNDGGYLQVTRLSGKSPSLIVVPIGKTPFEAYNPLNDDPTPRGIAFEGFYEWMVCSKAYAGEEWKNSQPWNLPTSVLLAPGQTKDFGLKFIISGTARDTQDKLIDHKRPATISVPGYVVPLDVKAKLFLRYQKDVKSMSVFPKDALVVTNGGFTPNGWRVYNLEPRIWGRARVTVEYKDGTLQTIHYKIINQESKVVSSYGNFLATKQWFEDPSDIFKRSPSIITYDYEKSQKVVQDNRAWISGLSDEGGAGSWLGAIMKQLVIPNQQEVAKLQRFIDTVMFDKIQLKQGKYKYGVKKSIFYYEPDSLPKGTYDTTINFKTWSAWKKKDADDIGRSYNYPHVAAAHWVMYRLARNYKGLVPANTWKEHLTNAAETGMAMVRMAPYYAQFGQMEGTIFFLILQDLKREGLNDQASKLEVVMKKRADHWRSLHYPFGSEMPWDSTGQEEVYLWSDYFGYADKAQSTLDAILAYMPSVPHWAYHGNARRYWDFQYGGKIRGIERMIHHYGSGLNAIPLLSAYRQHPDDFYLLQVGYGGLLGTISNITHDGFAPAAFHSYPSLLKNDGISGDYGSGFFGYAVNTSSYLVQHNEFGWLSFGGNLSVKGSNLHFVLTTAGKSAVYIAPIGLWINLESGSIDSFDYDHKTGLLKLKLAKGNRNTADARIRISRPASKDQIESYTVRTKCEKERGAYKLPLSLKATTEVIIDLNK